MPPTTTSPRASPPHPPRGAVRAGKLLQDRHCQARPAACPGGGTAAPKMAGPRPQPQGPVCLSSPQVPGRCADPLARTVAVRASPIRPKTGVRAGAISGDSARCRRRTDLGLGARPSNRLLERRARSQRLPAPPSPSTAPSGTAGSAPFRRLFGQNLIDLGRSEKVGSPLILPRHEALGYLVITSVGVDISTGGQNLCHFHGSTQTLTPNY